MSLLKNLKAATQRQLSTSAHNTRRDIGVREDISLELRESDTMVSDLVWSQDSVPRASRLQEDYLHVSSLSDICTRAYVLGQGNLSLYDKSVTGGHRIMWEIGLAVERHVVGSVVKARNRYGCYGTWTCLCGQTSANGLYNPRSIPCGQCKTLPDIYSHAFFKDDDAMISGAPDLILVNHGKLIIVEIKSMDGDAFGLLTSPLPDHIFQALSYRRLAEQSGHECHDDVIILYVTKKFKFGKPYKEYRVSSRTNVQLILDLAWADARAVATARRNPGSLPPRLSVCRSIDAPRPKTCSVCGECFARRN